MPSQKFQEWKEGFSGFSVNEAILLRAFKSGWGYSYAKYYRESDDYGWYFNCKKGNTKVLERNVKNWRKCATSLFLSVYGRNPNKGWRRLHLRKEDWKDIEISEIEMAIQAGMRAHCEKHYNYVLKNIEERIADNTAKAIRNATRRNAAKKRRLQLAKAG